MEVGGQYAFSERTRKSSAVIPLIAAAVNGMTAEGFLMRSENAYCPPTSMVKDVVISAVEDLCKNLGQ